MYVGATGNVLLSFCVSNAIVEVLLPALVFKTLSKKKQHEMKDRHVVWFLLFLHVTGARTDVL
jgi:predicted permease